MTNKELQELIDEFLTKTHDDQIITIALEQNSLAETVRIAILSQDENKLLHPHQHRIGHQSLTNYYNNLSFHIKEIEGCKNFDKLYKALEGYKVKGIGKLTLYDIAIRIATFMEQKPIASNMLPNKVYLHAGAKTGAERLLGRRVKRIEPKCEFSLLQKLSCNEIENFLCHYADKLSPVRED